MNMLRGGGQMHAPWTPPDFEISDFDDIVVKRIYNCGSIFINFLTLTQIKTDFCVTVASAILLKLNTFSCRLLSLDFIRENPP